jgi:hypothetical protein
MLTREEYINHILMMRSKDETYARYSARYFNEQLPWLEINQGLKEAIEAAKMQGLRDSVSENEIHAISVQR